MVDKAIYEQVHQWMEAHKENMIHDIQRIVKIPSISKPEEEIDLLVQPADRLLMRCCRLAESMDFIRKIMSTMWEALEKRKKSGMT